MKRSIHRTLRTFPAIQRTFFGGLAACCLLATAMTTAAAGDWEASFAQPPDSTKPWVYWYWISDNISKDGLTRDLEAMRRVGIGEVFIGNIFLEDTARGSVRALSPEWWEMVEHAVREGGRLGVNISLFNCPGWSQSGGPWIAPQQAMRYLVSTERRVSGPGRVAVELVPNHSPFQEISVLAFKTPRADADTAAARRATLSSNLAAPQLAHAVDGRRETVFDFPPAALQSGGTLEIDLEFAAPFTARSLTLHPAQRPFSAECELQVADRQGHWRTVRAFPLDRTNVEMNIGPMKFGPVAISFPAVTATRFRVIFTQVRGAGGLAELELSGAARLERYIEKQLGKMHPTPQPRFDTYLWPTQAEPDEPFLAVDPQSTIDLTGQVGEDGTLHWDAPPGDWMIVRTGMTPTGVKNAPASPEGRGLEVDKMNRQAAAHHFDAFIGELLRRMPPQERPALTRVVADSYEMGSQNWTDGLEQLFRQQYGYDPLPWLPVLTGRLVGSADRSERFLWDLRRLIADRIAYDYVGGLRDLCHEHGLQLWLENYGHWGFPAEFLQYGGQSDRLGGEFWATGDLGSIELRAASSAAHIYGQPIVSAEAFTGGPLFASTPWSLKRRGDWAVCDGINHFVLHVYIHQPDDRQPGVNAWFGTEFNRHNTWFEQSRAWIDAMRRTHFLLQQGLHVADVAYFIGEDTPKMTGVCQPPLPRGYDFDYINAEVLHERLRVEEGRFVLPDGKSYSLLVLPQVETMRPDTLERIRDLVVQGGAILGDPPVRSPSLQDYPACDDRVRRLAAELWSGTDGTRTPQKRVGRGRVFRGMELDLVLAALKCEPDVAEYPADVLWTHRQTAEADLYFLTNQSDEPQMVAPRFRVTGKQPEFWSPDSARIARSVMFEEDTQSTRVAVDLPPRGSVFVVFRAASDQRPAVRELTRDGEVLATLDVRHREAEPTERAGNGAGNFTISGWMRPRGEIALPRETDDGVFIHLARNDAVWAEHGAARFNDSRHACAGLSVGRNGVVVFEHSAAYFAPLLVQPAELADWTHVALVYEDHQPSLYLDGQLARRGLRSRFIVHPGDMRGASPEGPFRGELGPLQLHDEALSASAIAERAQTAPLSVRSAGVSTVEWCAEQQGPAQFLVAANGTYQVTWTNGEKQTFQVDDVAAAIPVNGPWTLHFPPSTDAPQRLPLENLMGWTDHADEAVRHFSGTAVYRCTFTLDSVRPDMLLSLGHVESVAQVVVNGRSLGTLWKPPFSVEVSDALRVGENELEIHVTNTWRNRLIGDKKFPDGFPDRGPLQFRPYLAVDVGVKDSESLLPSGLFGPVTVHTRTRVTLP